MKKKQQQLLTLKEALQHLTEKFTSGNSIEVERNTITKEEWIPIRDFFLEKFGSLFVK